MRAVITIRTMKETDAKERRRQGTDWVYEAVNASGLAQVDPASCPVERTAKGKPYFPALPQVCFSISHSGPYWACVVADQPVGLDIQKHKGGRLEDIAGRFFHPAEASWLRTQPEQAFFDVWASKESYVKWTGRGIDRYFDSFSVVGEDGLAQMVESSGEDRPEEAEIFEGKQGIFYRWWWEDYSLCLCGQGPWESVDIRWV